ncbi:hypothetical protein CRM22_008097, partial [Opisthorchis felineus]
LQPCWFKLQRSTKCGLCAHALENSVLDCCLCDAICPTRRQKKFSCTPCRD